MAIKYPIQQIRDLPLSERLTPTERAELYHYLPPDAEVKGLWNRKMVPFMAGVVDAFAKSHIREVYLKKSTQISGTEAVVICSLWAMDYRPGNILYISADDELAQYVCKKRFRYTLQRDARLSSFVEEYKKDEIVFKSGLSIYFNSAQSVGAALGRPFRYVILDEVDSWRGIKNMGDMIQTFRERTETYSFSKMFCLSKPVFETSHINNLYNNADVQCDYFVQCTECGGWQPLRFSKKSEYPTFIDDAGQERLCGNVYWDGGVDATSTQIKKAGYRCAYCTYIMTDTQRRNAVVTGQWRERNKYDGIPTTIGLHINRLYSLFQGGKLSNIVSGYIKAKKGDTPDMQAYVNNTLAESWKVLIYQTTKMFVESKVTHKKLAIPDTCEAITMGVDTQLKSFYYSAWGWENTERGYKGYLIEYGKIEKDWNLLKSKIFNSEFFTENGRKLDVFRAFLDTGGSIGEHLSSSTEEVYTFARKVDPLQTKLWVIKGSDRRGSSGRIIWYSDIEEMKHRPGQPARKLYGTIRLWHVITQEFYDLFFAKLNEQDNDNVLTFLCPTDPKFIDHLTSHEKVIDAQGRPMWKLKKGKYRHDWLDTCVYALAAANTQANGGIRMFAKQASNSTNKTKKQEIKRRFGRRTNRRQ